MSYVLALGSGQERSLDVEFLVSVVPGVPARFVLTDDKYEPLDALRFASGSDAPYACLCLNMTDELNHVINATAEPDFAPTVSIIELNDDGTPLSGPGSGAGAGLSLQAESMAVVDRITYDARAWRPIWDPGRACFIIATPRLEGRAGRFKLVLRTERRPNVAGPLTQGGRTQQTPQDHQCLREWDERSPILSFAAEVPGVLTPGDPASLTIVSIDGVPVTPGNFSASVRACGAIKSIRLATIDASGNMVAGRTVNGMRLALPRVADAAGGGVSRAQIELRPSKDTEDARRPRIGPNGIAEFKDLVVFMPPAKPGAGAGAGAEPVQASLMFAVDGKQHGLNPCKCMLTIRPADRATAVSAAFPREGAAGTGAGAGTELVYRADAALDVVPVCAKRWIRWVVPVWCFPILQISFFPSMR